MSGAGNKELKALYELRFEEKLLHKKSAVWNVLCKYFFGKWVSPKDTVVDVAAGYCEFINCVKAKKKYAFDLNPDVAKFSKMGRGGVNAVVASCFDIGKYVGKEEVDVFFISNFLEHLPDKDAVGDLFKELVGLAKPGGRLLVLQPNIRLVGGAYWDFYDHKVALTEKSLAELAQMNGLKVELCIPRFLPYTMKSAFPQAPWVVWLYLKLMPFSGFVFGRQSFMVFRKPE
ncbi:MAG: class I SAM-dependent methyltransferase [Eubacterium sp.]|nr:class I SAM-dependent methyltransferase [Eubacterium sp.]